MMRFVWFFWNYIYIKLVPVTLNFGTMRWYIYFGLALKKLLFIWSSLRYNYYDCCIFCVALKDKYISNRSTQILPKWSHCHDLSVLAGYRTKRTIWNESQLVGSFLITYLNSTTHKLLIEVHVLIVKPPLCYTKLFLFLFLFLPHLIWKTYIIVTLPTQVDEWWSKMALYVTYLLTYLSGSGHWWALSLDAGPGPSPSPCTDLVCAPSDTVGGRPRQGILTQQTRSFTIRLCSQFWCSMCIPIVAANSNRRHVLLRLTSYPEI